MYFKDVFKYKAKKFNVRLLINFLIFGLKNISKYYLTCYLLILMVNTAFKYYQKLAKKIYYSSIVFYIK